MTAVVDYALVGDGGSDRALLPILKWALRRHRPAASFALQGFAARGGRPVGEAIDDAMARFRPTLLFVHRDAERQPPVERLAEIPKRRGVVPVVPVRMTEAWLLIDEHAVRRAANNPNGTTPLSMPSLRALESLPSPKDVLKDLLLTAADAAGPRRRQRFDRDYPSMVHRVADTIEDFGALDGLAAFRAFTVELRGALDLAVAGAP